VSFAEELAVELIGDRVWWPSTARGGGVLDEVPHEEPQRAPAGG